MPTDRLPPSPTDAGAAATTARSAPSPTADLIRADVLVLGAGIVGVSSALMLARAGLRVALIDRRAPGEETSHGNAGLIERSSIVPYHFPRDPLAILRYALNRRSDMRYDPLHLPRVGGWLYRFWRESGAARLADSTRALRPLIEGCTGAHATLADLAGPEAGRLIRKTGWIELLLTPKAAAAAPAQVAQGRAEGLVVDLLDPAALAAAEPGLTARTEGAIFWRDPWSVADPGGLVRAYAAALPGLGGVVRRGDAEGLERAGDGWAVPLAEGGRAEAPRVVLALGPWTADLLARRFGLRLPMAVKRGHHMVYDIAPEAMPRHPLLDEEGGYVLAPTTAGLRLTTGIEFAPFDAPANTIQLDRAEARARRLLPLGARKLAAPWLGRRPCLPDMRPVIGPADAGRLPGLWLNFGHAHHGLTLGPVTGALLTQMMTGAAPLADPADFAAARFARG